MVLCRALVPMPGALPGQGETSAAQDRADLRPRARDQLLLPTTVHSMEPRSRQATHTHTVARYNRVRSAAEGPTDPQLPNRVGLAMRQCARHDREALEKSSGFRRKQAPSVLDKIERPGRGSACESSWVLLVNSGRDSQEHGQSRLQGPLSAEYAAS